MPDNKNKQSGFTLLELLMVTAILGTLVSVAVPSYQHYSRRAQFSEILLLASPYRVAIEAAAYRGSFNSVADMDFGKHGIPDIDWASLNDKFVLVLDGRIYAFWGFDGSELQGTTYILQAMNHNPPIQWQTSGTCINLGYC